MTFFPLLKKVLRNSCYGFCAMTLLYSFIMLATYGARANMGVVAVILFYPFSFIIAFTRELLLKSNLTGGLRAFIRYLSVLLAFGLCICLPNKENLTGAVAVVLFVCLTLVYIICELVFAKIHSAKRKKLDKKSEYKSVYGNVNKK